MRGQGSTRGRELLRHAVDAIQEERFDDLTDLLQENASQLQAARLRLEQKALSRFTAGAGRPSEKVPSQDDGMKQTAGTTSPSGQPQGKGGRSAMPTQPRQGKGRRTGLDVGSCDGHVAGSDGFGPLQMILDAASAATRWADAAPWAAILLVQVLVFAAYAPACFYEGFIMDDAVAIERNPNVVSEEFSLTELMRRDYWGLPMHGSGWTNKSFRPLTTLTFRWNYLLHGLQSSGFHIANVLLHCAASVIVGRSAMSLAGLPGSWAAVCAALFGTHPVHTENVLYLVGRADVLAALLGLLALTIYADRFCPAPTSDLASLRWSRRKSWFWEAFMDLSGMITPMLLIIASGMCKETGSTLFAVPFLMEVHDALEAFTAARGRRKQPVDEQVWRRTRLRVVSLVGTTLIVLVLRYRHTGGTTLNMSPQDNPISFESSKVVRMLSYAFLHGVYAKLLFWPSFLCYDYSMDAIPMVTSLHDCRLLLTLFAYVAAAASVTAALSAPPRRRRAVLVALAILALTFLPASNVLFPVGTVIGERLLYIPSAGFCIAVIVWLQSCCAGNVNADADAAGRQAIQSPALHSQRAGWVRAPLVVALVVFSLCGLATRTLVRTRVWSSSESLFLQDGKTQPTSSKTQFNLGITHMSRQEWDSAIEAFMRCAWADPLSSLPFYRIGQIEILRSRFDSAERFLSVALDKFGASLMVRDEEVFHDLAIALFQNGKVDAAERRLRIALQLNPDFAKGWSNLACCIASRNIHDAARAAQKAVSLAPDSPQYWANFALLAQHAGDPATAAEAWQQARALYPAMPEPMDCTWEFAPAG